MRCCEKYTSPTRCPECGGPIRRDRPWGEETRRVWLFGIDAVLAHDRPLTGSLRTRDDDYFDGYDAEPAQSYDETAFGPFGTHRFGRWRSDE